MNKHLRMLLPLVMIVLSGQAPPVAAQQRNPESASLPGPSEIPHLRYDNASLGILARDLERRSGIVIAVPKELAGDRLSRDIRAVNWSDAVKQGFEGYDYAAETDAAGNVQRIFLQARINRPASSAAAPALRPSPSRSASTAVHGASPASPLPKRFQGLNPSSVVPIDLPLDRLGKLKRGDSFSLNLGGEPYRLFHDRRLAHESGSSTWVGNLDGGGGEPYRALLTYAADGSVVGRIATSAGVFKIEQADGKVWAIDMKATGLRPGTLDEDQQGVESKAAAVATTRFLVASRARPSTVDLMVLYAPSLNEDQPLLRVDHLVALTRQAFADSEVFVELRLVHAEPLAAEEQKLNRDVLRDLSENRVPLDVAGLRKRHGADLVALVQPLQSATQGNCGVAWVGGTNGQPVGPQAGFAVVSDGYDGRYYCHDYTLAHELGHIFGNVHDRHLSEPGIFPFSFAWGVPGRFATIMSYLFDEAPLVGKFANPKLACTADGLRCGDAETADNARTINLTAPTVAAFMDTTVH